MQMAKSDPKAQTKSSLSDCTWLEDLSMDLSSMHLRTYEAKRTEEHLYCFFTFKLFMYAIAYIFCLPVILVKIYFSLCMLNISSVNFLKLYLILKDSFT